jgi:LPXTG-motif cell wall-anchored protein
LIAPKGYSLNADVATVTVNSSNATAKVTTTVTKRTYTTTQPDGVESVGWLWNNTFYTGTNSPGEGAEKAYLDTTTVTTSENTVVATGSAGDGTVLTTISDTKLSTLPATGGIGTTIFTVLGCLLMITAAGLYFASRKKNEK